MTEEKLSEKETPFRDLIDGALKHYDAISKETCNWNSLVPEAIKFYGKYRYKVEALEADKEILQHNVEDLDNDYKLWKTENQRLKEKADKWDEYTDPNIIHGKTGDFGAAMQQHFKFEEAKKRLRAASDWIKTKRISKDFAFTVGFVSSDELDELDAILKGNEPIKWNAVDFLKNLNEKQLQELLQAVSLIVDPLGQELIKKASSGGGEA